MGRAFWRAAWADGRLAAVLSAVGFSMKGIFVKLAYMGGPVDPVALVALRMVFALPIFLWLMCLGRHVAFTFRDGCLVLGLGFLGYYLSSLFDFIGLQFISVGLERLILFTYPALVVLGEWLLFGKRIGLWARVGLGVSYPGLCVAFFQDIQHLSEIDAALVGATLLGAAWVFGSCVTFSGYYLGLGVLAKKYPATRLSGMAGASSVAMIVGHFLATRPLTLVTDLPLEVWGWAFAMAIFSTALPIWLATWSVSRLGAGPTAAIGTLGPVLTMGMGWAILNEPMTMAHVLGMAMVLVGVWMISRFKTA